MKKIVTNGRLAALLVVVALVIDQVIKIWVKTHMYRGQSIRITDWFYIYFTENNGMAFGMEIVGKLFLTSFRLIAAILIIYYMVKLLRKGLAQRGFIVCLSLILAGALGNIIDCLFYGLIFSESTLSSIAHFVPMGEGYESLMYGRVVDMFYFPIIDTYWPTWMPLVGGSHFIFFSPIFNFADACISCGVIALLLFYSNNLRSLNQDIKEEPKETKETK